METLESSILIPQGKKKKKEERNKTKQKYLTGGG